MQGWRRGDSWREAAVPQRAAGEAAGTWRQKRESAGMQRQAALRGERGGVGGGDKTAQLTVTGLRERWGEEEGEKEGRGVSPRGARASPLDPHQEAVGQHDQARHTDDKQHQDANVCVTAIVVQPKVRHDLLVSGGRAVTRVHHSGRAHA